MGGGVGNSPPGGSSPGGPPNGPGGSGRRPRPPPSAPPVTAILTTAGVTFLTISEKPCAIDGGTPAADAVEPLGNVSQATATTHRQINARSAFLSRLHMVMTTFLPKVRQRKPEAERHILHYPFLGLQRLKDPFAWKEPGQR